MTPSRRWIVTGARAPVAIDLARALVAAGCEVHLADCCRPYAAVALRPKVPVHRLPAPRTDFRGYREALTSLLAKLPGSRVLPTCEEVFWLAEAAARDGWSERLHAPPPVMLRTLHSKADFISLAGGLGLDVPQTHIVESRADIAALPSPTVDLVFKPEFSRFASHTLIAPSPAAVAALQPRPGRRWVAQRRVIGEEICSWALVQHGKVQAYAAYRPRWRQGHTAAFQIEAVAIPAVRRVTETIAQATGMTGHLSLDVIVEPSGRALPIECNPRAVSGLHLFDAAPQIADALDGAATLAEPETGRLRHMGPAMALLGLPQALRYRNLPALLRDWRNSRDVIDREGGGAMTLACLADATRFAVQALRNRRSPAEATTADIEWDGEAMA